MNIVKDIRVSQPTCIPYQSEGFLGSTQGLGWVEIALGFFAVGQFAVKIEEKKTWPNLT